MPVICTVTITGAEGDTARGCPRHAVAVLDGITGARVDWADSRGLNEHETTVLRGFWPRKR